MSDARDEWFVIRKRDAEPIELYPFHSEDEANAFYDLAAAQWSETFVVRVVRGPKVLPPPPMELTGQALVDAVNSGALPLLKIRPIPDRDVHGGERIYPCTKCGVMRSKAEGGTVFTVCDECWDAEHPLGPVRDSRQAAIKLREALLGVADPRGMLTKVLADTAWLNEQEESRQTRWVQCGVSSPVEHLCTGDATYGQFDSSPMVCAAFVEVHKKLYPRPARR